MQHLKAFRFSPTSNAADQIPPLADLHQGADEADNLHDAHYADHARQAEDPHHAHVAGRDHVLVARKTGSVVGKNADKEETFWGDPQVRHMTKMLSGCMFCT